MPDLHAALVWQTHGRFRVIPTFYPMEKAGGISLESGENKVDRRSICQSIANGNSSGLQSPASRPSEGDAETPCAVLLCRAAIDQSG